MQKRKYLFLVDGFGAGGAEIQLLEILRNFPVDRYEITVCSLLDSGPLKKDYLALGVNVVVFQRKHRFDFSIFYKLYNLFRQQKFDVVIPILFYPDILGTVIGKLTGIKTIISWAHASHENVFFKPLHRRLMYRFVMPHVSCIVTVSEEMKESIIKKYNTISAKKIFVVPNAVDLNKFALAKHDPDTTVIGVVARLDLVKGHTYLIQALALIKNKFPDLQCIFSGGGTLRGQLEAEVKSCNLEKMIRFVGYQSDVPSIMAELDIFVLPSISEGLPNVILEAMAANLPVIASAVGGIPEVVGHEKTGLLVPPENPEELAKALDTLLSDLPRCKMMGQQGRKIIEQRFSRKKQVEALLAVFNRY